MSVDKGIASLVYNILDNISPPRKCIISVLRTTEIYGFCGNLKV